MTTPTNRSHDPIEDRLAAAFDRATKRAQVDLTDGRLAVGAGRGRQRHRRPPVLRSGLVLAVVAVVGAGAIWAVGSQRRPAPTTPPRAATSSGGPSETPWPTGANGSPIPVQAPRSPAPILQSGQIFPSAIDGAPIYSVGGPAEAHVAEVTDGAPFYISGWVNGWELQGRPAEGRLDTLPVPLGTFDPATDYYDKCWGPNLSTTAGGPPSLHVLDEVSRGGHLYAVSTREPASAIRLVLKVHVHDTGCTIP